MAGSDVEVCFYQYELPEWIREYFGIPSIKYKFLPPDLRRALRGRHYGWEEEVSFRVKVCPMGWSWAVSLVQAAHGWLLRGLAPSLEWVEDKRPNLPLVPPAADRENSELCQQDAVKILYIDNFAIIGQSKEVVEELVTAMEEIFAKAGIVAVRDPDAKGEGSLLGFSLNLETGEWRPNAKRYWKVLHALDYILEKGVLVSGKEMERLVGHVVSICMLRRESLSWLHNVYSFMRATAARRQPLWPCVRRELRWARALLPLVVARGRARWAGQVTAIDASPWGFGVVESDADPATVASVGRLRERSRFRGPLAAAGNPRMRALKPADDDRGVDTFREVEAEYIEARDWKVVAARRWRRRAAIHTLEAEAPVWSLRRLARSARAHHLRHLIFRDNF